MSHQLNIVIKKGGGIIYVDDDRLVGLLRHNDFGSNPQPRTRASHLEPGDPTLSQDPRLHYADLSPVRGPVLGGFATRAEALAAEHRYLSERLTEL